MMWLSEAVAGNTLGGVRQKNLGDPLPHRCLIAPVIRTEGKVHLGGDGSGSSRRQGARSLALKDELQGKQGAVEGGGHAGGDLSLVFSTNDRDAAAVLLFVGPACGGNQVNAGLIHVDDERRMDL